MAPPVAPQALVLPIVGVPGPQGEQGDVGPTGPQGPAGDAGSALSFIQSATNQSLVQINHGLPFQPAGIVCIDSNGVITEFGAIAYPMAGTLEITFGVPWTGTIYLS